MRADQGVQVATTQWVYLQDGLAMLRRAGRVGLPSLAGSNLLLHGLLQLAALGVPLSFLLANGCSHVRKLCLSSRLHQFTHIPALVGATDTGLLQLQDVELKMFMCLLLSILRQDLYPAHTQP